MIQNEAKLTGTRICSYTLKEFLGKGVLGEVYRSIDLQGDIFAIKVISEISLNQNG